MKRLLFFANLVLILFFIIRWSRLPPQIPLFYSRPWGEDQLVDSWMIFMLPIFMTGCFFLNELVYQKFFVDNLFVKKIIYFFNLFIILGFSYIFLKILLLVT